MNGLGGADCVAASPTRQRGMNHALIVASLIGCVSLLYATAGQAGGTAFLAVMAFAAFPAIEMRATALLLNIVAALRDMATASSGRD
jgi:hypothetical protein